MPSRNRLSWHCAIAASLWNTCSFPMKAMASLMATERFFAKYLAGRHQEGGTPEVTARLREITVDPKTVVLAKKVDAGAVGLPKLAMDPKPVTNKYKEKL